MEVVRNRGRQRSRVLYVFRTPPGVRVGREPLDSETRRLIEQANPGIDFDWDALIRSIPPPEPEPEVHRPRRVRRAPKALPLPTDDVRRELPAPEVAPREIVSDVPTSGAARSAEPITARPGEHEEHLEPAEYRGPRFPTEIEGETIGSKLAWLRVWHAETVARIEQEIAEEPRRTALLSVTERLNPAGWHDAEAIERGLADATQALGELAAVFDPGRHRSAGEPPSSGEQPDD